MSQQANMTQKHGAIADSAADPMEWDLRPEQLRAMLSFTCTASANTVLHVRESATLAELDAALEDGLFHQHSIDVAANVTKRVLIARDPSLPFGRAWVATGAGDYVLNGSRYTA